MRGEAKEVWPISGPSLLLRWRFCAVVIWVSSLKKEAGRASGTLQATYEGRFRGEIGECTACS